MDSDVDAPWWYSQSEERWNGPCESREEAISEGFGEYDDESFMVMQATQGDYDLSPHGDTILDWLEDINDDRVDPDGADMFGPLSKEMKGDLSAMVSAAVRAWALKYKLSTTSFCFTKQWAAESVPSLEELLTIEQIFKSVAT